LSEINEKLQTGSAREHSYRPAFQKLIEEMCLDIQVINEPAYTGGNAPDFLFKKGETPIAYAECKDVSVDISDKEVQKQAKRYVDAFGKILLTNYYDFKIINETGEVAEISIAEIVDNKIVPKQESFDVFANLIKDYMKPSFRTINSAKKLAEIMASKARLLRDNALASFEENQDSDISEQYKSFKEVLIHDLTEKDFADMYAQTLVYGLFVARYFDGSLNSFSRYEAQDLLPASNPLLKKFFGHVAGTDYDPKISWLVDSLIEAYLSADVRTIMHKEFVKKQKDPVLHFYETFLKEYDKDLRKNRGVYYTPEPVVSFIVRSVDEILKNKFDLPKGLTDTTKIKIKEKIQQGDARTKDGVKKVEKEIHKVQILDPAVGTGTFLNEVINEIYKSFKGQEGIWPSYVNNDLLPRLHGFELMMASYTMAHLKLGITLKELGCQANKRLSVWLTNSLDASVHEVPNLFMSQWLTEESNQASKIKSELPIMVVLGNPPYSGVSSNNTDSANKLSDKYKIEPGGEQRLQERKHWLNDDYVKFISFAENQIEKTGEGIISFITNHGYIDNTTFRGMRWHLLNTFDEIYILDLHGNSKKKEMSPDGEKDENVFNIQQGVAIILAIKKNNLNKKLADVYHADIFGRQKKKYEELDKMKFDDINWKKIKNREPYYFFVQKDYQLDDRYQKGFSISDMLSKNVTGIVTMGDSFVISDDKYDINKRMIDIKEKVLSENEFKNKWKLGKNYAKWFLQNINDVKIDKDKIVQICYRPFDMKWLYFDNRVIWRCREKVMKNFLYQENIGLSFTRQAIGNVPYSHVLISKSIIDNRTFYSNKGTNQVAPLYIYHKDGSKIPNLDREIWEKVNSVVGETEPEDILDYIYAVLHSPSYREKYKEFLKIDFPRVPYPENKDIFWKLVKRGRELRQLHLMELPRVQEFITTFPKGGSNMVEKVTFIEDKSHPEHGEGSEKNGKVYINSEQYFGNVSEIAWNFYIGGYQPAQKWLKDRKGRELSIEDIEHYQKIIVVLNETDRVMKEIDKIKI